MRDFTAVLKNVVSTTQFQVAVSALVIAAIGLYLTSWSVSGSDDFHYLSASLGIATEFSHWELRWPAYMLQAFAFDVFGATPSGIWASRWLIITAFLIGVGFLGYVFQGQTAALASIIFIGFCPVILMRTSQGWIDIVEATWACFIVGVLYMILRKGNAKDQLRLCFVLGALLGLALLSRITALLFFPMAGLVWLFAGRSVIAFAVVALGILITQILDAAILYGMTGDAFARWTHLATQPSAIETFGEDPYRSPPVWIRFTYGLPRILLEGTALSNPWKIWLVFCGGIVGLSALLNWKLTLERVGLLILAAAIGALFILVLPSPRGTFALRILPRYFMLLIPLLGVAAVICAIHMVKLKGPLFSRLDASLLDKLRLPAQIGAVSAFAAYIVFAVVAFLNPQKIYSQDLRDGMTVALEAVAKAETPQVIVADQVAIDLFANFHLGKIGVEHSWIAFEDWDIEDGADTILLLDVPHRSQKYTGPIRNLLADSRDYTLTYSQSFNHCWPKTTLPTCEPQQIAILATRNN